MRTHDVQGISAIVPAYNEEKTILAVVRKLERHPLIDEVIVVNDGSTDGTARKAAKTSAVVINLAQNKGKGEAMAEGVARARFGTLLFVDADLVGLTDNMITMLIRSVESGRYDMFTLVRDRKTETFQMHLSSTYVVGGERALKRTLWDIVPAEDRSGFGVEMALNYYAQKHNMNIGHALAPGLKQVAKERKRGLMRGLTMRAVMFGEVMYAVCKLHVLRREGKNFRTA